MTSRGDAIHTNDGQCHMFRPENMADFASAYLGDASPADPRASPVHADLRGLPPLVLQVSSTELLFDDARAVHERIQATHGESRLEIYDDVFHCWQMSVGLVPEAREAMASAARFIEGHFVGA